MLLGLVLLAFNIQYLMERLCVWIFLFWAGGAKRSMVIKNLAAHRVIYIFKFLDKKQKNCINVFIIHSLCNFYLCWYVCVNRKLINLNCIETWVLFRNN